jgi:hypothetical protein
MIRKGQFLRRYLYHGQMGFSEICRLFLSGRERIGGKSERKDGEIEKEEDEACLKIFVKIRELVI